MVENPAQKFTAGGPSTSRDLNIVIGDNVKAGRILMGFTKSQPGNWTSWPPHEHTELLEEVYVYFDMPAPAFGIQLVYTEPDKPEFMSIVRDGDAVLMPAGYHPNVAAPGHGINFIWMMAAHRDRAHRAPSIAPRTTWACCRPAYRRTRRAWRASRRAAFHGAHWRTLEKEGSTWLRRDVAADAVRVRQPLASVLGRSARCAG